MKEQLVKLINAFASARASGDEFLLQMAAAHLQDTLNKVEIVPAPSPEPEGEMSENADEANQPSDAKGDYSGQAN